MADLELLARLAATLPGVEVTEPGCCGVAGKGMTWTWKERVHPKQARVPNLGVIAFRTVDVEDKHALIETHPAVCFTEPHYNGYPAVLVRLAEAPAELVAELLADAWRRQAPKALSRGFDLDGWLAAAAGVGQ